MGKFEYSRFIQVIEPADAATIDDQTSGLNIVIFDYLQKVASFIQTEHDQFFYDDVFFIDLEEEERVKRNSFSNANQILTKTSGRLSHIVRFFEQLDDKVSSDNSGNAMCLLTGPAGAGKTSFMNWFLRNNISPELRYIYLDISEIRTVYDDGYFNILCSLSQRIYSSLYADLRNENRERFFEEMYKLIYSKVPYYIDENDNQEQVVNEFLGGMFSTNKQQLYEYSITMMVSYIYIREDKPFWFVLDNVDLEGKTYQKNFWKYIKQLKTAVSDIARVLDISINNRFVVPVRPETKYIGLYKGMHHLEYAYPNMIEIFIKKLNIAFNAYRDDNYSRKLDRSLKDGITMSDDKMISNIDDLINYINSTLRDCLIYDSRFFSWRTSVLTFKDWHFALLAGNVRKYINYMIHVIMYQNFVDFIVEKSYNRRHHRYFTPHYRYLELLIKGVYKEFNEEFSLTSGTDQVLSPIIYNIFGLIPESKLDSTADSSNYTVQYFVYIRILQYLGKKKTCKLNQMLRDLSLFFDTEIIEESLKFLVWSRIIDEINLGIKALDGLSWRDIPILNEAEFKFSITSRVYLSFLLENYTYILCMSRVTEHPFFDYSSEICRDDLIEDDRYLYSFVYSLKQVLIFNLLTYMKQNVFTDFLELFYYEGDDFPRFSRPWRRIMNSICSVLTNREKHYRGASHDSISPVELFEKLRELGLKEFDFIMNVKKKEEYINLPDNQIYEKLMFDEVVKYDKCRGYYFEM